MRLQTSLFILLTTCFTSNLVADISLKEMPIDLQRKTGVFQLSEAQKRELERWINTQTNPAIEKNTDPSSHTLTTLVQNNANGSQLVFSNNTSYDIAPEDQKKAANWISPVVVKIEPNQDKAYPWNITNINTKDVVKGKPSVMNKKSF
ncbi:MAG: hypothetical protein N3A69_06675 [Leptospiraceae bacterium]|nr:hypothetical protein [Leptospiraceae bacterium]